MRKIIITTLFALTALTPIQNALADGIYIPPGYREQERKKAGAVTVYFVTATVLLVCGSLSLYMLKKSNKK